MILPKDYLKEGFHWTINEDFKADYDDALIAILLEDDDDLQPVDWYFFSTREEAEKYIKEDYARQGVECPEWI